MTDKPTPSLPAAHIINMIDKPIHHLNLPNTETLNITIDNRCLGGRGAGVGYLSSLIRTNYNQWVSDALESGYRPSPLPPSLLQ